MTRFLVITGGSRGIGKETILRFLEAGWKAINISRSNCDLPNVINITIDLNFPENIEAKAQELVSSLKAAEVICLVHNAVFYKRDTVENIIVENLRKALDINVIAPVILNQIIIPLMSAGSSIIYIGSTLSEKGVPGNATYTTTKHATVGLMRATCQDLAVKQIASCCICPGLVDTDLLHETIDADSINWLINNKIIGKRLIQANEISRVIYFVATNPVINGVVLHANTGQLE